MTHNHVLGKRLRDSCWQSGSPVKMTDLFYDLTDKRLREALFYNQPLLVAERES